jgi:hypothetical protein
MGTFPNDLTFFTPVIKPAMFSQTPWSDYFIAVTALLVVYYILFAFRFYRTQIKAAASGGTVWWKQPQEFSSSNPDHPARQQAGFEEEAGKAVSQQHTFTQDRLPFDQIVGLGNQLIASIDEAHEQNYDATELALLLQMVLKDYPSVHGKAFQIAINEFIDNQCAKYGSLHLGEEDKAVIWDQV